MARYSNDDDLIRMRPSIMDKNVTDWEAQHVRAERIINRTLEVRWYKEHSAEQGLDWTATPFDPDLVQVSFVKDLACCKVLELAYTYLAKDSVEEDAYSVQRRFWEEQYEKELENVLASGLGYDWDASGVIESDERLQPRISRLQRM